MPRGDAFKRIWSCGVLSCANRSVAAGSCGWVGGRRTGRQSWWLQHARWDAVTDRMPPSPATSWGGKWHVLWAVLAAECGAVHAASAADAKAWSCPASSMGST